MKFLKSDEINEQTMVINTSKQSNVFLNCNTLIEIVINGRHKILPLYMASPGDNIKLYLLSGVASWQIVNSINWAINE